MQAAFLADREQKRQRRVGKIVLQQGLDERHQHGAARAVVATERGRSVRHDAVAFALRLGPGAQRHRVEMGGEQQLRPVTRTRKLDDQIAGFSRQRDPCVCVIEADGRARYADAFQLVNDRGSNLRLMTGHAVD